MKRGNYGTFHYVSPKHLDARPLDTMDQMQAMVLGVKGKWLRYADLVV